MDVDIFDGRGEGEKNAQHPAFSFFFIHMDQQSPREAKHAATF